MFLFKIFIIQISDYKDIILSIYDKYIFDKLRYFELSMFISLFMLRCAFSLSAKARSYKKTQPVFFFKCAANV